MGKHPSDALLKFQKTYAPNTPLDSEKLTHRLIREITKLKQDIKEA
jgi:hypothetical protein